MMVRWNGSLFIKFEVTNSVSHGEVLLPSFVFCLSERSIMRAERSEYLLPYE